LGAVFLTVYFTLVSNLKNYYQSEIKVLSEQLESKKVFVYEAKDDITAGSKVTMDNLKYTQVLSEQSQNNFITGKEIGKVALIDIKSGTGILKSMLTDDLDDGGLREAEFNTLLLSSNLKDNDHVDIRILFPNGENYIVLSKKAVKNLSLDTGNCFMWLNAEELLRISGAVVDCYLNEGSKLYTVKYIEPDIQEASLITYTPGKDVIKRIREDPNVVQKATEQLSEKVRMELEARLEQFYYNHNGEIAWDQYPAYNQDYNGQSLPDSLADANDTDNTIHAGENIAGNGSGQSTENGEGIYYVD